MHSDIPFCTYVCFCSYVWSTKHLVRKSSLFLLPFMYITLETIWKIWIQLHCTCVPAHTYLFRDAKKSPKTSEDLDITRDFLHQLGEITQPPHTSVKWKEHVISPTFSWFDWKFLKAETPVLHLCRERRTMKRKFSFGYISISTMQINIFFPLFHLFKEEDTIYLCLRSAWGMKYL